VPRLEQLEDVYRRHHREHRPEGFVFGGAERSGVFREWVGTGKRVLDLGCRSGALTRAYAEGNAVVGVDVDREALAEAAKLGIETIWADVDEALPFDADSFDVVVAGELLEHVRFPDHVVAEAARLLRPGGRLVGSVPNAFRLKNRLRFLLGHAPDSDPTHLRMFGPADVRALLASFRDVELRFVAGRLVPLGPRLFANDIVFRGRRGSEPR
jgi:methionine biosynthesis protein MetW